MLFLILLRKLFLHELLDFSQGMALSGLVPEMLGLELEGGAPELKDHGKFELEKRNLREQRLYLIV